MHFNYFTVIGLWTTQPWSISILWRSFLQFSATPYPTPPHPAEKMVDKAKSHSMWKVSFSPFWNQLRKNCYGLHRNHEDNYAGGPSPHIECTHIFLTSHCIGVTEKNMTISKCFCPSNVFRTNHYARCTAPTWSHRGHCSLTCVRKLSGNGPWGQNKQTEPEEGKKWKIVSLYPSLVSNAGTFIAKTFGKEGLDVIYKERESVFYHGIKTQRLVCWKRRP